MSRVSTETTIIGRELPIVEHFYSIQGEGYNTGRAAYFVRLAGCKVGCKWCDAKESWNEQKTPYIDIETIIEKIIESKAENIVITGGEPLLHNLNYFTSRLHELKLKIFLETSGTAIFSGDFDWICLSPKQKLHPLIEIYKKANELKVVIEEFENDIKWAEKCKTKVDGNCRLYLQPEWSKSDTILPQLVEYVKNNPHWSISLQTHKFMAIP